MRLVDLDSIAGLEQAWSELERVHAIRAIDPQLRRDIERCLARLPDEVAAPVLAALDEQHPELVLAAYFGTIVPRGKPTIGAVRRARPRRPPAPPGPRPLTTYSKVLTDMRAAGWRADIAAEAVAGMALEDGVDPVAVEAIRRGRTV